MKLPLNSPVTEQLESRLLLSGGSVSYQFQITDLNDTPLSAVEVGQDFKLSVYTEDLTPGGHGVFAGYLDIVFDQSLVHPSGGISFGVDYPNGHSGDNVTSGLLNECGGFSGLTTLGDVPNLLFSVTFHADATGNVTFIGNPADNLPGHDTLVYGSNSPISTGQLDCGQATLHVVTSIKPTVELAHPLDGSTVELPTINVAQRYIDVTYADVSGSGLDVSSITDAGDEFTLEGDAASGVLVDGSPTLVSGTTYRYTFTGDFGEGLVTVDFAADSFADNAGNSNASASESFTLIAPDTESPTAQLFAPADGASIGDATINARHYIEVTFADAGGSGLNVSTITDAGPEFTLSGAAASGVTVNGAGVLVSGTTYRYAFSGTFADGDVTVSFNADSVADNSGNKIAAQDESFTVLYVDVLPPTGTLSNPADDASINDTTLNHRGYIDITFGDTGGSGLDLSTITDAGPEFMLSGAAANGVTVDGTPVLVSGTTYRYGVTGSFGPGTVTVDFLTGGCADLQGNLSLGSEQEFTVVEVDVTAPTANLANPTNGGLVYDAELNRRGYIDVTFADLGPSGLNLGTITDAGAEFTLGGAAANGVTVDGTPVLVSGTTYRYTFTGAFTAGQVTVNFVGGAFADNADNPSVPASETFDVASGAPEIFVSGNGQEIVAGDVTPGTTDGTAFGAANVGAAVVQTFTIRNDGTAPLNLTGQRVLVTGADAADFTVTAAPSATIAGGGSTTFDIRFSPIAAGDHTATITILSNDANEGSYSFDVQGVGGRSIAFGGVNKAGYIDQSGDAVTIALKDIGSGQVWFASADPAVHADAVEISLAGTGIKSVLSVSAKGVLKRTSVTNIVVEGPLKQITGSGLTVNGSLLVEGTLGNLTVEALNGCAVDVHNDPAAAADPKSPLVLAADVVANTSLNTHGQPIKSISVWEWTDTDGQANDSITASWIGSLSAKGRKALVGGSDGNFAADLDLAISRDTLSAKLPKTTLGSVSIAGTMSSDLWQITGDIGTLKAAAVTAGQINAWTIKSITTTGIGVTVIGDFAANLHLAGSAVAPTLGGVSISGSLKSTLWNIVGGLGNITVGGTAHATVKTTGSMGALSFGAVDGADFLAGVTTTAAGDPLVTRHADDVADLNLATSIKSLSIKGLKNAAATTSFFKNSNFSAGSIGAVSLVNVAYDAGQPDAHAADRFGFWAGAIKSVTNKNLAVKTDKWSWPKQPLTAAQIDLAIERLF